MAKFKAIFFDNDGLLVDTESLYLIATREVLHPLGIKLTDEFYIHENLGKGVSSFELARQKGISEADIEKLRAHRDRRFTEMIQTVQPIDGVRETLEELHGKVVMGVVTSSPRRFFDVVLRSNGLAPFFSFFITADDVVNIKPDPEPYLKAVEHTGMAKEDCLVFEDSRRGAMAAKAAGLTCYAIPDGLTKHQDLSFVDKILGSIREIPALVL